MLQRCRAGLGRSDVEKQFRLTRFHALSAHIELLGSGRSTCRTVAGSERVRLGNAA
jgi:hypothetical protein